MRLQIICLQLNVKICKLTRLFCVFRLKRLKRLNVFFIFSGNAQIGQAKHQSYAYLIYNI